MPVAIRVHAVGSSNGVPHVQALAYTGTPAIVIGTIGVWAAGFFAVGGADPTEIVGVALQAVDTNPGFAAANSPATITGRNSTVSVVRPNNNTIFLATLTNGSSATATPAQTDVGVQYGLTAYSGIWTVDKANAADRVEVVGFDTLIYGGVVFFKFLPSVLADN